MPEQADLAGELALHTSDDGLAHVHLRASAGTAWLFQRGIAELFAKDVRTTNERNENVTTKGKVGPNATIRKFRVLQNERNREVAGDVEYYNPYIEIEQLASQSIPPVGGDS